MAAMEITTKIGCSINCRFCPQKVLVSEYFKKADRPEYLSFTTFQTCLDKLPAEVMINFAGMCEPWLNPECTKMVKYAAQRGHKIGIYTTLEGMREEDVEALSQIDIHKFVLHVPDADQNSRIEVTKEYLAVLKKLMEKDVSCLASISCHGSMDERVLRLITSDWKQEDTFQANDRAGNLHTGEVPHQEMTGQIYCNACGRNPDHNVLLPDGTVVLCCMDYGMEHIMGNLLFDSYEDIINGREADKIRRNMAEETERILCRKCQYAVSDSELAERYLQSVEQSEEIWAAKCWLEKQNAAHCKENEQLKNWRKELEDWCKELEGQCNDLKDWCEELTQAKCYLAEKCEEMETKIKEKDARVHSLEEKIKYEKDRMRKIMEHPVLRRMIVFMHLDI